MESRIDEDFKRAERLALGITKIVDNVHQATKEMVNHPAHYGGDNPLEVIKIIDHYELGFALANSIKYILRSDKKGNKLEDLKKAAWYLQHEINKLENV
jgi:phosphopantothenate synthetase